MTNILSIRHGRWRAAAVLMVGILLAHTPTQAAEQVQLQLRLKEGQKRFIQFATDQTITQTLGQRKQTIKQTIGFGYLYTVEQVDEQGNARTHIIYKQARYERHTSRKEVVYDSTRHEGPVPPAARGFAAMIGHGFTFTISPQGQVLNVKGIEDMRKAILAGMGDVPPRAKKIAARMLKRYLSRKRIKSAIEKMWSVYPPHPIGVGESWSKTVALRLGMVPMVIETTYTLKDLTPAQAKVHVDSSGQSLENPKPMQLGPMSVTYNMQGTQEGTLRIDRSTGWVEKATLTQHFSGTIVMKMPRLPQPKRVPMSIDSTVTITTRPATKH